MDEQFDNELKNRISKVFENFEHPSADKGWWLLQEKLPETGNNRGFNWLWAGTAVIAILFLFFGVRLLVKHQEEDMKKLSQKNINHHDYKNKIASQNKQNIDTLSPSNPTAVINNSITNTVLPKINSKLMAKTQPSKTGSKKNQTLLPEVHNRLKVKTQSINRPAKTHFVKTNTEGFLSSLNKKGDTTTAKTINANESLAPQKTTDTAKNSKVVLATSSVANNDTAAEIQSLIAGQKTVEKADKSLFTEKYNIAKPLKIAKKDRKKMEFGIYAAAYFNYARGINSQVNAGAGVTADIRLFKNLKLSTGVGVAQNTLDYGNQLPNLYSVVNTGASLASNLQRYGPAVTTGVAYSLVLQNYTARLLELDVPLNLKYEFNSRKNDRYFSMGLSSGAFIHQSYTYQYNYSSVSAKTIAINTSLSSFYFAKTLNVAFGLSYPVGKANHLIVEPFLKYPLSGLGDEGIRFGASGINLKFDFQSSKK